MSDKVVVRGPLLKIGEPTMNGRIYPKELIEREIERLKGTIDNRRLLATFGSSSGTSIPLRSVAGVVTDMVIKEEDLETEIKLLKTPMGESILPYVENGGVRFEPYGSGVIEEDGTVSDWVLSGVAIVPGKKT